MIIPRIGIRRVASQGEVERHTVRAVGAMDREEVQGRSGRKGIDQADFNTGSDTERCLNYGHKLVIANPLPFLFRFIEISTYRLKDDL